MSDKLQSYWRVRGSTATGLITLVIDDDESEIKIDFSREQALELARQLIAVEEALEAMVEVEGTATIHTLN